MTNTNQKTITVLKGKKQTLEALVLEEMDHSYVVKLPNGRKEYYVYKWEMKLR